MSATSARARRRNPRGNGGLPLFPVAIGTIVLLGIVAIAVTVVGAQDGGGGESVEARPVTVNGESLPRMVEANEPDPAIGRAAPDIAGEDFGGGAVTIERDGRAKVIAFVAHWCHFCQEEIPRISDFLSKTGMPDNVDLYFVSTSVNTGKDNYPPSAWLQREGVGDVPTIVDDAKAKALLAFGAGGFPFIVFVGADGSVALRTTGVLPDETFDTYVGALSEGAPLT